MDAIVEMLTETIQAMDSDGPVFSTEELNGLCTDIAYHVPHDYRQGMIKGIALAMSRRDHGVCPMELYYMLIANTILNKSNQMKALRKRKEP